MNKGGSGRNGCSFFCFYLSVTYIRIRNSPYYEKVKL